MEVQYFPHFIRKNYPEIADTSNEDLIEMGKGFKTYLQEVFKNNPEKLKTIWDIKPMTIIMNQGHPLKTNGYDPAFIIHFGLYVEKVKKEIEAGDHEE